MKYIILTAALFAVTFTAATAQSRASKTENDAAMKAGREAFAVKAAKLETEIKSNNLQSAQVTVQEVAVLMRSGMAQLQNEINMEQGAQQNASFKLYNELEMSSYHFMQLSKNIQANGTQLLSEAKVFGKKY